MCVSGGLEAVYLLALMERDGFMISNVRLPNRDGRCSFEIAYPKEVPDYAKRIEDQLAVYKMRYDWLKELHSRPRQ